jgi:hypothetical protein
VRDLRSFQAAGYLILHQSNHLYDLAAQQAAQNTLDPPGEGVLPYYHLPYEALLYAPLALFSSRAAYFISVVANMLLLLACVVSAPEIFSRVIPIWQPRQGLALFVFMPVYSAILLGQDSLLLLLLCCVALRALERGRDVQAGALLALALFKFEISLPLLLLTVVRRGRRVIVGFLPAAVAVLGISIALIGGQGLADMRALFKAGSLAADRGAAAQLSMAIHPRAMPNLMGLVFVSAEHSLTSRACFLIVIVLSALTLGWGAIAIRRAASEAEAFSLAILCAILVSYHLYLHDATLLLIPLCTWGARLPAQLLFAAPVVLLFMTGQSCLYLSAVPILWLFFEVTRIRGPSFKPNQHFAPG